MFNYQNLVPVAEWPTKGFLTGNNLLDEDTFNSISNFDYRLCSIDSRKPYRKTKRFWYGQKHNDQPSQTLQNLLKEIDNFDLFVELVSKTVEDDLWVKNIDALKKTYVGPILSINIDTGPFHLLMHIDGCPNLQIYLEGDEGLGTRFHYDAENFKQLPFIPNSGYFQVNNEDGKHSAKIDEGVRKHIMIYWQVTNMGYPN